jgi:hypothetical protein
MAFFVQLLANYSGLIYIALIIGVAFYLREIFSARQELQQSLYSLEREAANSRLWRGIMMLFLLGFIAVAIFVMSNVIAPGLATDTERATPTPPFILTTTTPTPTFQPTPTRTPRPPTLAPGTLFPTIEGAPTATLSPTPAPLPSSSCPDPNVQIVAPIAGQAFSGPIQVRGTADAPNFAFYKFTLSGPATNNATQTAGDVARAPVRNGVLGAIDTTNLVTAPGVYVLGLVVVDNTGNELPHCTVPILIQP